MAFNIHFFRDNNLEKLDFKKVFDFFDNYPNFKIFYGDDVVEIVYRDLDFQFSYQYLVTKQSRVNEIYKLNPKCINVKFLLEMPVLIPTFLAKELLSITQKVCKLFELDIYHDSFTDVQTFNFVDVLVLFENMRNQYIEEYGLQGKLLFDSEKLSAICKYQRSIDNLNEFYNKSIAVPNIVPIADRITNAYGISTQWNVGEATIFPPHIDYVYINDEESGVFLVKRSDFYSLIGKYLTEIIDFLPDMHILKDKQAKKVKKMIGKLRKYALIDQEFKQIRMCDLIDG